MSRQTLIGAIAVAALSAAAVIPVHAQNSTTGGKIEKVSPDKVERKPVGAFAGISSAFITGAFDMPGLYVASSALKAGSVFPPHRHPDLRITVVVSGTMYLSEGAGPEEGPMLAYPAGAIAITPAGVTHSMSAQSGDFSVLEIGSGPSATEMIKAE